MYALLIDVKSFLTEMWVHQRNIVGVINYGRVWNMSNILLLIYKQGWINMSQAKHMLHIDLQNVNIQS